MAETLSAKQNATSPIWGPVFIATVYPVFEVDRDLVEWVEPIPDAYSFWGKTLISDVAADRKAFFPAPLSYPYRFSEKGVQTLRQKLEKIPEIDSATIKEQKFPNIPPDQQNSYNADEKKKFLIDERYISFKFKDWLSIEFMKFPTFIVLAFDHTTPPVNSIQDYRRLADDWKKKVQAFHKNDNLKHILGRAHKKAEWRSSPLLTLVAFPLSFERGFPQGFEPAFRKSYLQGWEEQSGEAKLPFLRDVMLGGLSGDTYPSNLVLKHSYRIIYAYDKYNPSLERYYYYPSSYPLFYHGNNWPESNISPYHESDGALARVLRSALFVNVSLPSMVDLSKELKDSLGEKVYEIQKMRMELFDNFAAAKLDSSHAKVRGYTDWYQRVIDKIDRIDELQKGFSELLEDSLPDSFLSCYEMGI